MIEQQDDLRETGPGRIVREQTRELRERKDEDEVEEELERRDPDLAVALGVGAVCSTAPTLSGGRLPGEQLAQLAAVWKPPRSPRRERLRGARSTACRAGSGRPLRDRPRSGPDPLQRRDVSEHRTAVLRLCVDEQLPEPGVEPAAIDVRAGRYWSSRSSAACLASRAAWRTSARSPPATAQRLQRLLRGVDEPHRNITGAAIRGPGVVHPAHDCASRGSGDARRRGLHRSRSSRALPARREASPSARESKRLDVAAASGEELAVARREASLEAPVVMELARHDRAADRAAGTGRSCRPP